VNLLRADIGRGALQCRPHLSDFAIGANPRQGTGNASVRFEIAGITDGHVQGSYETFPVISQSMRPFQINLGTASEIF
jgi:hypothetical protein